LTTAAAAIVAMTLVQSNPAYAGGRPFTFTWDANAVNKGDFEIEEWLTARTGLPASHATSGWLWFAPVYGLYDHVEIAVPWEAAVTPNGTSLTDFGVEARFCLYDPTAEGQFVHVLLRALLQQNFANPDNAGLPAADEWAGLDAIVALGDPHGTHATIDFGGLMDLNFGAKKILRQTLGAGVTFKLSDEWQLGAEYYHQLQYGNSGASAYYNGNSQQFFVGPDIAFVRGRVWATLGGLIGLNEAAPRFMPRLIVAVAL